MSEVEKIYASGSGFAEKITKAATGEFRLESTTPDAEYIFVGDEVDPSIGQILFGKYAVQKVFSKSVTLGVTTNKETVDLVSRWVKTHAPVNQIREIEALAEAVIGDKYKAHKWLSEPNLALDNKPPVDLLGTDEGYARVKTLLMRIETGILA
jgi:Protein of unknown function (DUF2384)